MCFFCQATMPDDPTSVDAPQNVRVHLADGRTIPVETVYIGQVPPDGEHLWVANAPINTSNADGVRVTADFIPKDTSLALGFITEIEL